MPYLTADQIRDRVPALDDPGISDDEIEERVAEFEDIAERYTGVAYLPREATHTVEVCGSRWLSPNHLITAVSSIEVEGVAVTGYTFSDGYGIDFGTRRTGTLEVTYTHGMTTPPAAILNACREYVRSSILAARSSVPRDVISQSGDGFTTRYSTPSWSQRKPTGWTEVDRLLNSVQQYRRPVVV